MEEDYLESWAARFGTPFYAYDAARLEQQAQLLRSVLPEVLRPRVLYSFKANPLPALAEVLHRSGCEADLTSSGELRAAVEAGFDLSRALYGGPGKSRQEYQAALNAGLRQFSLESPGDLAALSSAVEERGIEVRALLRINPSDAPKAKLAMSGVASQFGFEESWLQENGAELVRSAGRGVRLAGIHIYWGTQIAEVDALISSFAKTVEIAGQISQHLGFPLEVINFGGGFAWPYAHSGEGPDLTPLCEALLRLYESSPAAQGAEWWFESGRFLTAASGSLVARVMDQKISKDKHYLILDTGIHHLGGMSGLGRIPRFSIELQVPEARRDGPVGEVEVVGQLCTPLDCLAKKMMIPRVETGDLVRIPNVGAYGVTASVVAFLSRPAPVEILYRGTGVLSAHRMVGGHAPCQPLETEG